MSTRTTIAAAVMMAALAVPAGAQQHQHDQMAGQEPGMTMSCPMMPQMMQGMHGQMMMGGMEGMDMQMEGMAMRGSQMEGMGPGAMGMMGAMHGGPCMILRSSEALGLTPAQTDRLEALEESVMAEHREHMQAAMASHRQAAAALEDDAPDLDAYRAALDEAADHMVMAQVAMTRATLDARDILTAEQRQKLGQMMRDMHRGMMEAGNGGAGHSGHH